MERPGQPPHAGAGGLVTIGIVCLGDSTTAGTPGFLSPIEAPPRGAGNEKSQFAYWMARAHAEWEVLNRGVNGERSDQILGRFERDVVPLKPRFVVVLAGVNDVYQGFPPEFTHRNLTAIYGRTLDVGATPVACTILPYNTMGEKEKRVRRETNGWIRAQSTKLSIPVCDTGKAAANPDRPDNLAGSPDGLHPDVDGYRRMGEVISKTIEDWLAADLQTGQASR